MAEPVELLRRARDSAARQDWRAVAADLATADAISPLPTQDLRTLATAHWWLGRSAEAMRMGERVFDRLVDPSDPDADEEQATLQALELGLAWATRGDLVVAAGWLNRARRLLDGRPTRALAYLTYLEASMAMDVYGEAEPARAAAATLAAEGRRHADPHLTCFARVVDGLADVRSGRVGEGFGNLDEAMLDVVTGRVDPVWGGDIFCTVIHLCHQLADLARMRAWTDALETWSAPLSRTFLYAGVTRVHQLQLVAAEGDWDLVEREMTAPSEALAESHGWMAGAGFYELGEIRRLRGDAEGAQELFDRVRAFGVDPQPGEAFLRYAEGSAAEAVAALRESLGAHETLGRARLLLPAVTIGLEAGDRALVEVARTELAETAARYASPGLLAWSHHADGAIAVADGRWADALRHLDAAAATYRGQRRRHATAVVHELVAQARRGLGDAVLADADVATALAIYRSLGAVPDVDRLETTTTTRGVDGSDHAAPRPGNLTQRECEVLARVASGETNRQVAQTLVISDKTVSRHLANIFTKIGVQSRTAAAAWAHAHGIHETTHRGPGQR